MIPAFVLQAYGLNPGLLQYEPIGSGLIHRTWKLNLAQQSFILQQVNSDVFANPWDIADNIKLINQHLQTNHPGYLLITPVPAQNGQLMVVDENKYYRLFPFAKNSYTINTVTTAQQAYEAAAQFGKFTFKLKEFPSAQLKITIPQFHDLDFRYEQLKNGLAAGNRHRIEKAGDLLAIVEQNLSILRQYQSIRQNKNFHLRVTHHDTKISNVLFTGNDEALCVIDLDTIMPGWFMSDVGDMMRTYLSPVGEEETDFRSIEIRTDVYHAIAEGYCNEMHAELSRDELKSFVYTGKLMMYMQAVRFLTDYINNDTYYGASYELHNYNRAKNQLTLLQRLSRQEKELSKIIK
jgi:Ser/Thr protein kinase RdoA (MazF antagonist)